MTSQGVLRAQAEDDLARLARGLEERLTGGTAFFEALDEALRTPYWYRVLLFWYLDEFPTRPRPVVSGKFGIGFATWLAGSEFGRYMPFVLVLPGDLRHNVLPPLGYRPTQVEFAFLDDSYYRGRTYGQIKHGLEECGGKMLGALVLYDGSVEAPVHPSVFRYHGQQEGKT